MMPSGTFWLKQLFLLATVNTVWPEILEGNLFWRIGGFESNPPIFNPPKLYRVSSLLRNHSFYVYNMPAAGRASVIVGMEFTIDSCVLGQHVSKEFWTLDVGEELACQRDKGNPNDLYVSWSL